MSDQPGWAAPDEGAQPGYAPPAPAGGYPSFPPAAAPRYDAPPGSAVPPGYGPPAGYPPPPGQWGGYGAGSGAPYAGFAAKPGVVALRPLGIGEILDGALSTVRSNWKVLLGSAGLIVGAYSLISFIVDLTLLSEVSTSTSTYDDAGFRQVDVNFGGFLALLPSTLIEFVALLALTTVCSAVVGRAVLGERPTWSQAWRLARPHLLKLLGVAVLAWLAIVAASILCGIGEIFPWVVFSLSVPALVLERGGVTGSLGRSFSLVRGAWWRTFWLLVLGLIIYLVITFAVEVPLLLVSGVATGIFNGAYAGGADVGSAAISALSRFLSGTITWPFLGCLVAVMYVDRRMRTEGLDLELQRATGVAPPPPAYQPPAYQPPAYQPPAYQPPAYQPPAYQPPAYQPPPASTYPAPPAPPASTYPAAPPSAYPAPAPSTYPPPAAPARPADPPADPPPA
jgi:hypothetical protein